MYYLSRVPATHEIQCVFDDCWNREKSSLLAVLPLCVHCPHVFRTHLLRRDYSLITIYASILVQCIYADFSELMNSTSHTRENPFG